MLIALITIVSVCMYQLLGKQCSTAKAEGTSSTSFKAVTLAAASDMSAAQATLNDSNWAGYIVASDLQNPQPSVTGINARWAVPQVQLSQSDVYAVVWIGIGGFVSFDDTLIQVGTAQNSIGGVSQYSMWYELLPGASIPIDTIPISPGDQINASIQLADPNIDEWSIYIEDLTTNNTFQSNVVYPSSQLSAEWIVERPLVNGNFTTLADVGLVTFTNCQAIIGAQNGNISSFPVIQSIMYSSVLSSNGAGVTQLAEVSDLMSGGESFTVETSQALIPELSVWAVLPLFLGTTLIVIATKKRCVKTNR
jgi:hypothetical protein